MLTTDKDMFYSHLLKNLLIGAGLTLSL